LGGNKRSLPVAPGRKGSAAAGVALAIILSLAIGGGVAWFFLAGAQARAREALRQAQEERERQSARAVAQLQVGVQADLEKTAEELKRLNYGSGADRLEEAIGKCNLAMNALVGDDVVQAQQLKGGLQQAKDLATRGDPAALDQVRRLRAEEVSPQTTGPVGTSAPAVTKPSAQTGEKAAAPPEGAAPAQSSTEEGTTEAEQPSTTGVPPAAAKGVTSLAQPEESTLPGKETGTAPVSPPPIAP